MVLIDGVARVKSGPAYSIRTDTGPEPVGRTEICLILGIGVSMSTEATSAPVPVSDEMA